MDVESVEAWLNTLHDIAAGQRLEGDVRAAHGLTTPRVTLEVTRSGVDGVERINVGARDEVGVAVSRDDEPMVLRFAPSLEETLRVEPLRFRPRSVVHDSEEDLRALLIDAPPLREELVRADGMWRLARPVAGDGDATQLGELGRALSDLDAERWVSATPRPEFGLSHPPRAGGRALRGHARPRRRRRRRRVHRAGAHLRAEPRGQRARRGCLRVARRRRRGVHAPARRARRARPAAPRSRGGAGAARRRGPPCASTWGPPPRARSRCVSAATAGRPTAA